MSGEETSCIFIQGTYKETSCIFSFFWAGARVAALKPSVDPQKRLGNSKKGNFCLVLSALNNCSHANWCRELHRHFGNLVCIFLHILCNFKACWPLFSMPVDCMRTLTVKEFWVRLQWGCLSAQVSRWFLDESEFILYWTRSSAICITECPLITFHRLRSFLLSLNSASTNVCFSTESTTSI